jgi:hypothetical protein
MAPTQAEHEAADHRAAMEPMTLVSQTSDDSAPAFDEREPEDRFDVEAEMDRQLLLDNLDPKTWPPPATDMLDDFGAAQDYTDEGGEDGGDFD